jgi:hypothetical protein
MILIIFNTKESMKILWQILVNFVADSVVESKKPLDYQGVFKD